MAVSLALRRLLRIRELQEDQCKQALESATGQLNGLENALRATNERGRQGQRLFQIGACNGELPDRLAGMEETHAAKRYIAVLLPRIEAKKMEVAALRQEYLDKRVERRQAETLIEEREALEAIEEGRKSQQVLDDWYTSRRYRQELEAELSRPKASASALSSTATQKSESAAKNT